MFRSKLRELIFPQAEHARLDIQRRSIQLRCADAPVEASELVDSITAYQAAGYPWELEPVLVPYSIGAR